MALLLLAQNITRVCLTIPPTGGVVNMANEIVYPNILDNYMKAAQATNAMYENQMAPIRMQNEFITQRINQIKARDIENEFATKMGRQQAAKQFFKPAQPAQTAVPMQTGAAPSYTGNAFADNMYGNQVETRAAVPEKRDYAGYIANRYGANDVAGAQEMEAVQRTQKADKMAVYKPLYDAAVSSGNDAQFQNIVENMKREGILPQEFTAKVLSPNKSESVITVTEGSVNPQTGQPWVDPISGQLLPPGQYSATAEYNRIIKLEPFVDKTKATDIQERRFTEQDRRMTETERHNREMEAKALRAETAKVAKGRRLPTKEINGLNDLQGSVERLDSLGKAFKDEYGGKAILGGLNTKIKDIGGMDTGQVNWWKDYKELDAIRRNAIFGASLTGSEKSSWDAITVNERSDSKTIQQAVANRIRIISEAYNRKVNNFAKGGYDVEEFGNLSVPESEGFNSGAQLSPAAAQSEFSVGPYKVRVKQ